MKLCISRLLALLICTASPAFAERIVVTSSANDGRGSLRAALAAASASDAASIVDIRAPGKIAISETLIYDGAAPLSIFGADQVVTSEANITLFAVTNGADLDVTRLTFKGPGGFRIDAREPGTAGKGVYVAVPNDKKGTVSLRLESVVVEGVAGHGIHVSDCDLADACGGGGGGAGRGSEASISVELQGVTVSQVGNGSFDVDGLRVDERGPGNITAQIFASRFAGVGADGVELDEGQAGSVIVQAAKTVFVANGTYCDPGVLDAYLPDLDEAVFDRGARAPADIPGVVTGSPDDACVEREVDYYGDGSVEAYEFSIDVDDGFDIDEAGPGSIDATLDKITVTDNQDEGLDFDEEDAGSIILRLNDSILKGNADDGLKASEEDEGGVLATLNGVFALSNGGKGAVFEEEDAGDVSVSVLFSTMRDNDDGDDTGIEVDEDDAGEGSLLLHESTIADGIDAEGIALR